MPTAELISLARAAAAYHELDPALVCAIVEQESAWNTYAIRYEPGFRTRYVAPLGLPATEEIARSISWGLMQVMGQVAREHGFTGKFLSALCDPAIGLDIGCAVLASKLAIRSGSSSRGSSPRRTTDGSLFAGGSAGLQASESDSPVEARGFSPAKSPASDRGFSPGTPEPGQGIATTEWAKRGSDVIPSGASRDFDFARSAGTCSRGISLGLPSEPPRRPHEPASTAAVSGASSMPQSGQGIATTENEIARALQLWNGGANPNYANEVLARLPHYQ